MAGEGAGIGRGRKCFLDEGGAKWRVVCESCRRLLERDSVKVFSRA